MNDTTDQAGALTPQQEKALLALLTKPTITDAAKAAAVHRVLLHRWLKQEVFATAYREARRDVVQHAISRLQRACDLAVDTLESVAGDGNAPPAARVSAARTILDLSLKAVELEDLAARVGALEALQPPAGAPTVGNGRW